MSLSLHYFMQYTSRYLDIRFDSIVRIFESFDSELCYIFPLIEAHCPDQVRNQLTRMSVRTWCFHRPDVSKKKINLQIFPIHERSKVNLWKIHILNRHSLPKFNLRIVPFSFRIRIFECIINELWNPSLEHRVPHFLFLIFVNVNNRMSNLYQIRIHYFHPKKRLFRVHEWSGQQLDSGLNRDTYRQKQILLCNLLFFMRIICRITVITCLVFFGSDDLRKKEYYFVSSCISSSFNRFIKIRVLEK